MRLRMDMLPVASSGVVGSLILYRESCVVRLLPVHRASVRREVDKEEGEKRKQCPSTSRCRCRCKCAHNRWEGTATPASLTTVVSPESHVSPPHNHHLRNKCGIIPRASMRASSEMLVLVSGECAAHNRSIVCTALIRQWRFLRQSHACSKSVSRPRTKKLREPEFEDRPLSRTSPTLIDLVTVSLRQHSDRDLIFHVELGLTSKRGFGLFVHLDYRMHHIERQRSLHWRRMQRIKHPSLFTFISTQHTDPISTPLSPSYLLYTFTHHLQPNTPPNLPLIQR
jgi:hypothetical protein